MTATFYVGDAIEIWWCVQHQSVGPPGGRCEQARLRRREFVWPCQVDKRVLISPIQAARVGDAIEMMGT